MPDGEVDLVFQPRAEQFEFFNLLIGGEIDLLLNSIDGVINGMIFFEYLSEALIGSFEVLDRFPVFRKLPQDWMMKVHGWNPI